MKARQAVSYDRICPFCPVIYSGFKLILVYTSIYGGFDSLQDMVHILFPREARANSYELIWATPQKAVRAGVVIGRRRKLWGSGKYDLQSFRGSPTSSLVLPSL